LFRNLKQNSISSKRAICYDSLYLVEGRRIQFGILLLLLYIAPLAPFNLTYKDTSIFDKLK